MRPLRRKWSKPSQQQRASEVVGNNETKTANEGATKKSSTVHKRAHHVTPSGQVVVNVGTLLDSPQVQEVVELAKEIVAQKEEPP